MLTRPRSAAFSKRRSLSGAAERSVSSVRRTDLADHLRKAGHDVAGAGTQADIAEGHAGGVRVACRFERFVRAGDRLARGTTGVAPRRHRRGAGMAGCALEAVAGRVRPRNRRDDADGHARRSSSGPCSMWSSGSGKGRWRPSRFMRASELEAAAAMSSASTARFPSSRRRGSISPGHAARPEQAHVGAFLVGKGDHLERNASLSRTSGASTRAHSIPASTPSAPS